LAPLHDLETAIMPGDARLTRREPRVLNGVAQAISHVASPPVLTVAAAFVAARTDGQPSAYLAAGAFSLLAVVVPMAALFEQWRRGEVSDIEITHRSQRLWPMLLTTTCAGIAAVALQVAGAPPAVAGLASILGVQCLVLLAVTTSWKISVHCASAASVGSLLALLGAGAPTALALVVAVTWSRLQLRRHTPAQCVAGASLGAALVLVLWPLLGG
jgi:membrane-associated phospholipid phosphatase